jgi:hypothetical protein
MASKLLQEQSSRNRCTVETSWRLEYHRAICETDRMERINKLIEAEELMQQRLLELADRQDCAEYHALVSALKNILILRVKHIPGGKYVQ